MVSSGPGWLVSAPYRDAAAMAGVVKGRVEAERLGLAPAACSLSAGTPAPLTEDKTLLAGRLVQEPPPPDYLLQDLLVRGIVGGGSGHGWGG